MCRDSWYCCISCDIVMLQFYFNIVYLNVVNVFFHFKFALCKVCLNLLFIHKYICMYFYLFHSNPCLMCAKASSQLNLNIICNPNLHWRLVNWNSITCYSIPLSFLFANVLLRWDNALATKLHMLVCENFNIHNFMARIVGLLIYSLP